MFESPLRQVVRSSALLAPLVIALLAPGLPAARAAPLTDDQLAQLAAGKIVAKATPDDRGASARMHAAVDIAAAPSSVWSVMTDCARAPRFVHGLETCRIVERDPGGRWDIREHRINAIAIMPRLRIVFRSRYDPPRRVTFSRTDGDLPILEGTWRLEPIKGGAATRLHYDARVAMSGLVPGFILRNAIESDLPLTLAGLRREVLRDSGR